MINFELHRRLTAKMKNSIKSIEKIDNFYNNGDQFK
jgi:hypothetical protein